MAQVWVQNVTSIVTSDKEQRGTRIPFKPGLFEFLQDVVRYGFPGRLYKRYLDYFGANLVLAIATH